MSTARDHRPPLGAHRLLGEGRGAALIRLDGEIDWWCPDRFDAAPALWSLLDPRGGRSAWQDAEIAAWEGGPAGPTTRTVVRIHGRRVRLWDGVVNLGDGSVIVRLARVDGQPVELVHRLSLGGFDGRSDPWLSEGARGRHGGFAVLADDATTDDGGLTIRVTARADDWTGFAISTTALDARPDLGELLDAAEARASDRMRRIRLPRRHPNRATDALRVLHVLTDERSGAPVASATTSLPEAPGGTRQFDYRYSWLRDSALAISTAVLLGHIDAAEDYLGFVASVVEHAGEHLIPLTTTDGGPVPSERSVRGVTGWAGSTPVRVGNEATTQRQLDSIAAIIESVSTYAHAGGTLTPRLRGVVDQLASMLADAPFAPTSGIWELREPARLVSEELARWYGLDQALRLLRRRRPWGRRSAWSAARAGARSRIEAAWDEETGRLPQRFDGADATPDASTLLAATSGFWGRRDPRLVAHVRATVAALEQGPFLRRYPSTEDGFDGREGAFLPASWWAVRALAVIGDLDAAQARADDMCAQLPPLLPEEWDVESSEGLGNTPLLWSHSEAARALYTLERERHRARYGTLPVLAWDRIRALRSRLAHRADR